MIDIQQRRVEIAQSEIEAVELALGLLPLTPIHQDGGGVRVRWWPIVERYMSGAAVPGRFDSEHEAQAMMACVRSGLVAVQRALEEFLHEHQTQN